MIFILTKDLKIYKLVFLLQERAKIIKTIPLNIQTTVLSNTCENSVELPSNKRSHKTDEEVDEETAKKMGPCFLCGRRKITRTAFKCSTCLKFTCKGHITCTKYTCEKCEENTMSNI